MLISSELGSNKCPIRCVVFSTNHAWLLYYFCKMRDGKSCYFLPSPRRARVHRGVVFQVFALPKVCKFIANCAPPPAQTRSHLHWVKFCGAGGCQLMYCEQLRAYSLATSRPSHGPWNRRRMLPSETGKEGDSVSGEGIFHMVWWPQKIP